MQPFPFQITNIRIWMQPWNIPIQMCIRMRPSNIRIRMRSQKWAFTFKFAFECNDTHLFASLRSTGWSQVVTSKQPKLGLTQELFFSRISESTTGYTFTPCVGFFTSPGIDTRQKGPPAFSLSYERHMQMWGERNCLSFETGAGGIEPPSWRLTLWQSGDHHDHRSLRVAMANDLLICVCF